MRVQLRIVAGSLRRRQITSQVSPAMRPTPQMVREALFSILGNAIPDRPFIDIFAGTGIIGMEALSRGAAAARFIERDFRLTQDIDHHLRTFGVQDRGQVIRSDAYRWAGSWQAPAEPVNVFLSPPFPDLDQRVDDFLTLVQNVQQKVAPGSVVVIQSERHKLLEDLSDALEWEQRRYGRNVLLLWIKKEPDTERKETGSQHP